MERILRIKWALIASVAVALLVFLLNSPGMGGVRPARAGSSGTAVLAPGFSWEYQLDFKAVSLQSAQGQATSLVPDLTSQGVATDLQALGDSMYRLSMTGDQGLEQVRQVIYSTRMAGFIGAAAEVQVIMPIGSLLDTPVKLDSNLTTGYSWAISPTGSVDFAQAGDSTYATQSPGYGAPSVQTLVLRPGNLGNGVIDLVYRRPFEPDEAVTRHLRITLGAQALAIDLTDPHPDILNPPASPAASASTKNPIDQIPLKGALPSSWDWRSAGIVPAPRDQGGCGACWAFGTVGVMESAIAKAGGPMTDLSEQFLVSCNTSGWSCSGGLTAHMWHYDTLGINQTAIGAVLEADKPYTATNGTCTSAYNHPYRLSGWQFITPTEFTMPTVDEIKNAIYSYGPITAGVCADSGWNNYTGGVYNPSSNQCGGGTNHQIILVGWDDATSSWILRNSWGPSWGESGYMRIHWDPTGSTSRVGEGTSWVTWAAPGPAPFSKTSPANASIGQPANPVLSWGSSSGATSYSYCVDTSDNNTCDTAWISTGSGTSVPVSGLATGIHFWQVRATNTSGTTEANAGTWWSFTVGQAQRIFLPITLKPVPPPAAFNKTAPANGATNQPTGPVLSWSSSSAAVSYEYCLDIYNDNLCNGTWTSTGTSTSATLGGLPLSTTIYWQVRAINTAGPTYADGGAWWSFTTASSIPAGIVNGDFEAGTAGWTEGSSHGWPVIVTSFPGSITAHSGSHAAWLGGEYDDISYVQQQVTISAGAPYLVYWHWIASSDVCGYDFGGVLLNSTVVDIYNLCSSTNTNGWVKHSVDLSAHIGQSVMLQIRAETDSTLNSNLFVDDVSLAASAAAPGQILPFVPNPAGSSTKGMTASVGPAGLPQGLPARRLFNPR
jgi:predicted secreted protein